MATVISTRHFETAYLPEIYSKDSASSKSEETLVPDLPDIPLPPLSKAPSAILQIDKDTPDGHVPRDPRLIRLTGVHPFNVEAPLTELFNDGACLFVLLD